MKIKGDRITFKDGKRTMVGVIERVDTLPTCPNATLFTIKIGPRLFRRWFPNKEILSVEDNKS